MKKQELSNERDSMPCNQLAHQIVKLFITPQKNKSQYTLIELLTILRSKKNINHQVSKTLLQKFSSHIQKELSNVRMQLSTFIDSLKFLSQNIKQSHNSTYQIKSIMSGIKKYFIKKIGKQLTQTKTICKIVSELLKIYFEFEQNFCNLICDLIQLLIGKLPEENKIYFEKQSHNYLVQYIKDHKLNFQSSQKCCVLIHKMNLYKQFKLQQLVSIAVKSNILQNINFFRYKDGKIFHQLVESFIIKEFNKDLKLIKKIIQHFQLNPFDYKEYIKALNKKSIRFFLNEQPIFAIDLKVKGRLQIIEALIQVLLQQGRKKQSLHFINKYYMQKFYHLIQNGDKSYTKNILQKYDKFIPTQNILSQLLPNSKYSDCNYLTLAEYGYEENSVIFVNDKNLSRQILNNIQYSPSFGIDCQTGPVYNAHQARITQTLQVSIDYEKIVEQDDQVQSIIQPKRIKYVYIFDIPQLAKNKVFREWFLQDLSHSYKGQIIGHTVRSDLSGLIKQLDPNNLIKVNIDKLKFVDVAQTFKRLTNQNKSSLQYICNKILNKRISKFQQCSGWHNRPLRKSQLHYAALDSVLPIILNKKLKTLNN